MAKKGPKPPAVARIHAIVDLEIATRVAEARAALKRARVYVSISAMVEVALLELLGRHDLAAVMRRHKATARRKRD